MHARCFLSLGTVQPSCKGRSVAQRWGTRSRLKLLTRLLPSSELLAPVASSWFIFPLVQQYLWHCTDGGITEMKGYLGKGCSLGKGSFLWHAVWPHKLLLPWHRGGEGEESAVGWMGDEWNLSRQLCCRNPAAPKLWLQATLPMLWQSMVWKNEGYMSAV